MSKPFDASFKDLFERHPADWLELAGIAFGGEVEILDGNLASVAAEADRVVRILADPDWLVHFEVQASRDLSLPRRMFRYNALLDLKFGLPVESVLFLLRPQADGPELDGTLHRARPGAGPYLAFGYKVIRVWTLSAEALLRGSLATLPMALIADAPKGRIRSVIRRFDDRLRAEASEAEAADLRMVADLLLRLRYPRGEVRTMFSKIDWIRECDSLREVHQEGIEQGIERGIVEGRGQGRVSEVRSLVLRLGTKKLGEPGTQVRRRVEAMDDPERLELMAERLLDATSWDEVVAD